MKIKNELKKIAATLTMISMMQGGMNNGDNIVYASESEFSLEQLLDYDYLLNEEQKENIGFVEPMLLDHMSLLNEYYEKGILTENNFYSFIQELYNLDNDTLYEVEMVINNEFDRLRKLEGNENGKKYLDKVSISIITFLFVALCSMEIGFFIFDIKRKYPDGIIKHYSERLSKKTVQRKK